MRQNSIARWACIGLSVSLPWMTARPARAQADRAVLREYTQRQQRAKQLAERLITRLLELQLQRMRDNGLTDLPLFKELSSMRGRIGKIAQGHMPRVQKTLAAAVLADGARRKQLLTAAQGEMQAILRRLIVERELVRARRQRAELIERIGEIISSQQNAHQRTSKLGDSDEQAMLAAIDQQNTTKTLFQQFQQTITTVASWSGELGAAAAEARRVLRASDVSDKLDLAARQLELTKFRDAAAVQQAIIEELRRIEIVIHKLQDPAWIGKDIARAVKEMIEEQEALRKKSRAFSGDDPFALLEEQTLLQEKLGRLTGKLVVVGERAAMLALRAEESASKARQEIFDDDIPAAVNSQGGVIGALVELQSEIVNHDGRISRSMSAMEYKRLAAQLGLLRKGLVGARGKQPQPSDAPAKAKAALGEVSKAVAALALPKGTPPVIVRRVATARAHLQTQAARKDPVDAESSRLANQLVRFAIGETSQGIDDALRNTEAMKLAELNRAAESISRALGAVRDDKALILAGKPAASGKDREEMLGRVKAIAEKVAEGVRELVPPAVASLKKAASQAAQLQKGVAKKKAEELRPLAAPLGDLSNVLESASAELRTEMVFTSGQLEEHVVAELKKLAVTASELDSLTDPKAPPTQGVLRKLGDGILEKHAAVGAALHTAADVLDGRPPAAGGDASQAVLAQRQVERARVLADIRRQELEELLETVQELIDAAQRQQQAAGKLTEARTALEAGDKDSVDTDELAKAFEDFANSLTEIGETVEQLTGQPEVANKPIAEAAQIASQLTPAAAEPQDGEPQDGEPQDGEPQDGEPQDGEPQDGDLTPGDPIASAQLLSGTEAAAIAAQALGLGGPIPGQGLGPGPGQGTGPPMDSLGDPATDDPRAQGARSGHDARAGRSKKLGPKPWTASLPEEVRASIRSTGRRELPRYYENRLKGYFQALSTKNE